MTKDVVRTDMHAFGWEGEEDDVQEGLESGEDFVSVFRGKHCHYLEVAVVDNTYAFAR